MNRELAEEVFDLIDRRKYCAALILTSNRDPSEWGEVFPNSGLIADRTPPFGLYPANFNHVQVLGNPFIASEYRDRFYEFCIP